jgi:UMP-CMP kinase
MEAEIAGGGFLEYAEVHGNLYATWRRSLQELLDEGKRALVDVDVQGAKALRAAGLDALLIFIAPASIETLEERLRGRGSESEQTLRRRMSAVQDSLRIAQEGGLFDVTIVNEELDTAVAQVISLLLPSLRQKRRVVFILGGPGSGKGTQCARLVQWFGYTHLSAGDLLRGEQQRDSPQALLIKNYIKEGKIVPVEITCGLLLKAMTELEETQAERVFLVDGFPRTFENWEGWQRVVGADVALAFVLLLECGEDVMRERLLARGRTSGRADDNQEAIQKRLRVLRHETIPLVRCSLRPHTLVAQGRIH